MYSNLERDLNSATNVYPISIAQTVRIICSPLRLTPSVWDCWKQVYDYKQKKMMSTNTHHPLSYHLKSFAKYLLFQTQ